MGSTTSVAAVVALAGALVALVFLPARKTDDGTVSIAADSLEPVPDDQEAPEPVLV